MKDPAMLPNLTPDVALAETLFAELRARSFDGTGITREAYGLGERMAHALLAEAGDALGLERSVDPVGNMYLTLPGADRAAKRALSGPCVPWRQTRRCQRACASTSAAGMLLCEGCSCVSEWGGDVGVHGVRLGAAPASRCARRADTPAGCAGCPPPT